MIWTMFAGSFRVEIRVRPASSSTGANGDLWYRSDNWEPKPSRLESREWKDSGGRWKRGLGSVSVLGGRRNSEMDKSAYDESRFTDDCRCVRLRSRRVGARRLLDSFGLAVNGSGQQQHWRHAEYNVVGALYRSSATTRNGELQCDQNYWLFPARKHCPVKIITIQNKPSQLQT